MNILMIAYYFPPDGSSGTFRPFYFANYLRQKGENIYVLSPNVDDFLPDQPIDYDLLNQLADIDIIRSPVFRPREALLNLRDKLSNGTAKRAKIQKSKSSSFKTSQRVGSLQKVKDFITFSLSSPDPHIGWLPNVVKSGSVVINSKKIDVIYATGSPWTGLIAGTLLKILSQKPLVFDYRDPWVSNPVFRMRPRFFRLMEALMERIILKFPDLIIANTEALRKDFIKRYTLPDSRVCTITNGFEKYYSAKEPDHNKFHLTHAGSLYFSRNPKNLLKATINLFNEGLINKDNFVINFVGGVSIDDPELEQIINSLERLQLINITPRVSFKKACEYQAQSTALFLIQLNFPLQVPRKLYENMASRKPILAITEKEGATAKIVTSEKIGVVVENRVEDIEKELRQLFVNWQKKECLELIIPLCDQYLNDNLCLKMRGKLREIIKKSV